MSDKDKAMTPLDFHELEVRDEAQIMREMKGEYLDEFVYQFQSGGRTVTGISWAGIKEVAYKMGHIRVDLEKLEEKDTYWVAIVKATDTEKDNSRLGVSTQSKKMKLRDGTLIDDEFSLQKVMSKAQRNAIRPLIPETTLKVYIERFLAAKGKGTPPPTQERKQVEAETSGRKPVNDPNPEVLQNLEWTRPEDVTPEFLLDVFEKVGLDPAGIEILETADNKLNVKPVKYLGGVWDSYNDVLKRLGAVWIREGKTSRWVLNPAPPKSEEEPKEEKKKV